MDKRKLVFPQPVVIYNNILPFEPPSNVLRILTVFSEVQPFRIPNAEVIRNRDLFDLILAHDEEILTACSNSRLFVFGTSWIDPSDAQQIEPTKKTFDVSFICGAKKFTEGHLLRQKIWFRQKEIKMPKSFWISGALPVESIDNNPILPISPSSKLLMMSSQFHIAIENAKVNNWFTEKLLDCFITKTIPIYWGCPNISNYFDPYGMIFAESVQAIIDICNTLNPAYYHHRVASIEFNYNICLKYCIEIAIRLKEVINEHFFPFLKNV
ncbi:MAG: hypothetical protein AB1552_10720 [Nitrospirota bacterium]